MVGRRQCLDLTLFLRFEDRVVIIVQTLADVAVRGTGCGWSLATGTESKSEYFVDEASPDGYHAVEELVALHLDIDDAPLLVGGQGQQVHDDELVDVLARVCDSRRPRRHHHVQAILDPGLGDQVLQLLLEVWGFVLFQRFVGKGGMSGGWSDMNCI